MINLTPRLKTIADIARLDSTIKTACDVGTDHGYIPVYLVQNGFDSVIATDISAPSANKAKENAVRYNLTDRISVRVGNGLQTIRDYEADCVIIAGMGGLMIQKILSETLPEGIKRFILQPMRSEYELRLFLCNNGFSIDNEVLCEDDNRIYAVMSVSYGKCDYDDLSLHYGRFERSNLYFRYIEKNLKSLKKQIDGLKTGGITPESSLIARFNYLSRILETE